MFGPRDLRGIAHPIVLAALIAVAATACAQQTPPPTSSAASPAASTAQSSVAPTATPPAPTPTPMARIEQPPPPDGLAIAPESARVDLAMPVFSDPTSITNPLFPVSRQGSVLLVGEVDGKPFRTEVTVLPEVRIIAWEGQAVEILVSQYVAFLDGRLEEVAYDFYAQADDGSVWYFGEDVFNFADGSIVDTHGSWLAGRDGPAAMIMPAQPKVGDVYRPENIPGLVFEEVTVRAVDEVLDGPFGPLAGGLLIRELHMEGSTEDKTFGPGYGEFYTSDGTDVEALALAVPADATAAPLPADLAAVTEGAQAAYDAAGAKDWAAADDAVGRVQAGWATYSAGQIPARVRPILEGAIMALSEAVAARRSAAAAQAGIDAARWSLDLQLRNRPVTEVDLARFGLWVDQLGLDAAAKDPGLARRDLFALDYIRDRVRAALGASDAAAIDALMEELDSAMGDEDFAALAASARRLGEVMASLTS